MIDFQIFESLEIPGTMLSWLLTVMKKLMIEILMYAMVRELVVVAAAVNE